MQIINILYIFCFSIILSAYGFAEEPASKDELAVWWHPTEFSVLPISIPEGWQKKKSSEKSAESRSLKYSEYEVRSDYRYLVINYGDKEARNNHITLMRIALIHSENNKIAYTTPWSLMGKDQSYDATYNPDNNTITVTWGGRPLVVLSEDELNKKSSPDLREIFKKEQLEIKRIFSPLIKI